MPYPENLYKALIRFNWDISSAPAEIQETGFWMTATGIGSDRNATCTELAERVAAAWATNIEESHFSSQVVGDRVNVYFYGDAPTQDAQASGEAGFTGDNAWTGTGEGGMPPENTLVVTTQAYAPSTFVPMKGRRQRGRMYPPVFSSSILDSSGRLSTGYQGAYLDSFLAFFADMTGPGGDPVTTSQPVVLSIADAQARSMTWLRVGRVVDTQRRRRNKLPEAYVTGEISA
jgi:hypothetical protein